MNRGEGIKKWSYKDASELYQINYWGNKIFEVSSDGEVVINLPYGDRESKPVSLYEIARGLKERGLSMPVLLRFQDILKNRIEVLNKAFLISMKEYHYKGTYQGVYPIKVNQQQQVVEEIAQLGEKYSYGLEAGSKAELIIALSYVQGDDSLIICNGYKDTEYIDLALLGIKMGLNIILVLERPNELDEILVRSKILNVVPNLGLRAKLSSTTSGKWAESAGDHSVFGLTASQIVQIMDVLKKNDMLKTLKLLHFHLGSQIPNIKKIRAAVSEASRYYVELVKEGAAMGFLDIGGGLAVDYDGSKTNFVASKNYTIEEYCADVIEEIMTILDQENIHHPTIVTESGRAVVAYYSVLLFNIFDVNSLDQEISFEIKTDTKHEYVNYLQDVFDTITVKNLQEVYHDAIYYRDEIRALFQVGKISLRERAVSDQLFWKIIRKIADTSSDLKYIPEELKDLDKVLSYIYYCNFSLFQSLPDSWAIDQLFPIMPVHRLKERPINNGILADITCDCDGKIDKFIDLYDIKSCLPLHPLIPGDDYYIGVFLVGAYQETLGDLHNLFGDTNIMSISLDDDGEILYEKEVTGDSVADVISYVEYEPKQLLDKIRIKAERAVKTQKITPQERKIILKNYEDGMQGYTYYES